MKSGIAAPLNGFTTLALSRTPRLGRSSAVRSTSDCRATSARNCWIAARSFGAVTSASTSGCSGASTAYVMPNAVSGRVVNTRIFSSGRPTTGRSNSAPSLLPIQLRCIVITRSGQPGSRSHHASSSSA